MSVTFVVGDGLYNSALAATGVPGAPTNLAAISGNGEIELSWTAPADTGTSAITDYTIMYREQSGGVNVAWTSYDDGTSNVTTATVKNLTNGKYYEFRVGTVNDQGRGPWATTSATPGIPGAPTNLTITTDNAQVVLTWTKPSNNGGSAISDYIIQYRQGTDEFVTFKDGKSAKETATVTGLIPGESYDFRVSARNQISEGPWSDVVPATLPKVVPYAPTNLTATSGNNFINLTWTPPSFDGGDDITYYMINLRSVSNGVGTGAWTGFPKPSLQTATSRDITSPFGTFYEFRVAAVNSIGVGQWSNTVISAAGLPSAPIHLQADASATEATLSWSAPTDSGTAISDYIIQYRKGAGVFTTFTDGVNPDTMVKITGLTASTSYEFRVATVNSAGQSPWSSIMSFQTLAPTVPGVPTHLNSIIGITSYQISWNAPTDDGGSKIIGYRLSFKNSDSSTWITHPDIQYATSVLFSGVFSSPFSIDYRVAAINSVGQSDWTDPITVSK